MEFDYSSYIYTGLWVPCYLILFVGFISAVGVVGSIKRKGKPSVLVACLLAFAFILSTNIPTLTHTVFLPFEGPSDAVELVGEVDKVTRSEIFLCRFRIDGHYIDSAVASVNGRRILFMSGDGLYEGAVLRIKYLPKSRVALSWEKADAASYGN